MVPGGDTDSHYYFRIARIDRADAARQTAAVFKFVHKGKKTEVRIADPNAATNNLTLKSRLCNSLEQKKPEARCFGPEISNCGLAVHLFRMVMLVRIRRVRLDCKAREVVGVFEDIVHGIYGDAVDTHFVVQMRGG